MRRLLLSIAVVRLSFNPRICKRCDCFWSFCYPLGYCFNPRICKRCDKTVNAYLFTVNVVSIHASEKMRLPFKPIFLLILVSIHASVKDATKCLHPVILINPVSIHASVKDATLKYRLILSAPMFQSTHL